METGEPRALLEFGCNLCEFRRRLFNEERVGTLNLYNFICHQHVLFVDYMRTDNMIFKIYLRQKDKIEALRRKNCN